MGSEDGPGSPSSNRVDERRRLLVVCRCLLEQFYGGEGSEKRMPILVRWVKKMAYHGYALNGPLDLPFDEVQRACVHGI